LVVGLLDGAFQPHLDQMQHTPVDDPARHRFHKFGMGNAPEEIREVGIDDFPVPAKQQLFHLENWRRPGRISRWSREAIRDGAMTDVATRPPLRDPGAGVSRLPRLLSP
jgi:hypothetical protein